MCQSFSLFCHRDVETAWNPTVGWKHFFSTVYKSLKLFCNASITSASLTEAFWKEKYEDWSINSTMTLEINAWNHIQIQAFVWMKDSLLNTQASKTQAAWSNHLSLLAWPLLHPYLFPAAHGDTTTDSLVTFQCHLFHPTSVCYQNTFTQSDMVKQAYWGLGSKEASKACLPKSFWALCGVVEQGLGLSKDSICI